jgi:hypothetical protein
LSVGKRNDVQALLEKSAFQTQHPYLYLEGAPRPSVGICQGNWKAIIPDGRSLNQSKFAIYDLQKDLSETKDLSERNLPYRKPSLGFSTKPTNLLHTFHSLETDPK